MSTTATETETRVIPKRLFTIPEAAEYLCCCEKTMRQMIWDGKLPEVRVNRRVLVDIRDLNALITNAKRNALTDGS